MEKRNTVLLTVIGLATLLVAVVGATFAYFTASMGNSGSVSALDVKTTKLGNTTFTFDSGAKNFKYLNYPGGLAVIGANVGFEKTTEAANDTNNYEATFNLKITFTNQTSTDLPWKLYVVDDTDFDTSMDPKCQIKNEVSGTNTYFWYGNPDDSSSKHDNGSCTLSPDKQEKLDDAKLLAQGKLTKNTEAGSGTIDKSTTITPDGGLITAKGETLTVDETHPLAGRKLQTNGTKKKYYYLVVEYPNSDDQTEDSTTAKDISVSLSAEDIVSAVRPA